MRIPSHADAYQVLLLQAADEGRGPILFDASFSRARTELLPFMVGNDFPDIYLEFPLKGEPFLDVTVLLKDIEPGTRITSDAARDSGAMLDWYARMRRNVEGISCGFELDTKESELPRAAVHYQPRQHVESVRPFFEAIGEPERADLYLDLSARMPKGWPLSFFGLFRGRAGSPLRVCGYLDSEEKQACAADSSHVAAAFDEVGFRAYDEAMLEQVALLYATAPGGTDFQFDIYPNGTLGDTFAIDVQFGIEQPELVWSSFTDGPGARVMKLLEGWDIADDRWPLGVQATFARSLPVELNDGGIGKYALTLMPQWVKVRWINSELQPSKLYMFAHAGLL